MNEEKVSLVIILGAIGGYVRWMHSSRVIVYDPERIWQWLIDSALTPLMGAASALVFCIAFRAGLTVQTAPGETANINWMGIYAVAGIAGLFSPEAIQRLKVTFQALFAHDNKEKEETAANVVESPSDFNAQTDDIKRAGSRPENRART